MKKLNLYKIGHAIGWFIGTFFIYPVRTAWNAFLKTVKEFRFGIIEGADEDERD